MTAPTPGWYADPADPSRLRWWDGGTWTDHLREAELATVGGAPAAASVHAAASVRSGSAPTSSAPTSYATSYAASYASSAEVPAPQTHAPQPVAEAVARPASDRRPRLRGTLIETVVAEPEQWDLPPEPTQPPAAPSGTAPSSPPPTSPPPGHAPSGSGVVALRGAHAAAPAAAPASAAPTAPSIEQPPTVDVTGGATFPDTSLELARFGAADAGATGTDATPETAPALRGPWNNLPLVAPVREPAAAATPIATTAAKATTARPGAPARVDHVAAAAEVPYTTPRLALAAPASPRTGASVFVALLPMISILLGTFAGVAGWALDPVLWYGVPGVTLIVAGLVLVLGHGDRRALARRGFDRPSWAWLVLSLPGYFITRGVLVRRRAKGGFRPLFVMTVASALALLAAAALVNGSLLIEPSPNTTALLEEIGALIGTLHLG